MGLGCGMNCLRILLFAFNFLFWLLGITVLAVGIWSRVEGTESWDTLIKSAPQVTAANMMIASGVVVTIVGFLGCCGALKKSPCMLISYAVLIFLIFSLELAAGIYAYTKRGDIQKEVENGFVSAVKLSYGGKVKSDQALTNAVDWFQQNVKCCGSAGPDDWIKSKWYTSSGHQVPESCCKKDKKKKDCNSGLIKDLIRTKTIYEEGCVPAVKDFVKASPLWKMAGVAVAIAVIQLLGVVFACCLCQAIKEDDGKSHV